MSRRAGRDQPPRTGSFADVTAGWIRNEDPIPSDQPLGEQGSKVRQRESVQAKTKHRIRHSTDPHRLLEPCST